MKRLSLAVLLMLCTILPCSAQIGSAFSYQGHLSESGIPANGIFDFQFGLWDAPTNGTSVTSQLFLNGISVSNGQFTAALDFGANAFTLNQCWLEILVRRSGASNYSILTPRQQITTVPYASRAIAADQVKASAISGTIPDSKLSTNIAALNANPNFTGTVRINDLTVGNSLEFDNTTSTRIGSAAGLETPDSTVAVFEGDHAGTYASNSIGGIFIGNYSGAYAANSMLTVSLGPAAGMYATNSPNSVYVGSAAGYSNYNASGCVFVGAASGRNVHDYGFSVFVGWRAGESATNSPATVLLGAGAGVCADNSPRTTYLGDHTGAFASKVYDSVFSGWAAGNTASNASRSVMIGSAAGRYATNAFQSIFIGANAGSTSADINNSIILGHDIDTTEDNVVIFHPSSRILVGGNTSASSKILLLPSGDVSAAGSVTASAFNQKSDRTEKEGIETLDTTEVLKKLEKLGSSTFLMGKRVGNGFNEVTHDTRESVSSDISVRRRLAS